MIGEILGAGASLIGGIMGARAEQQAAQMNYNIALMNYYEQQRQFNEATQEARKQATEGKQGFTDAAGTRVHYVPGEGWVTDLSPVQAEIQKGQQGEQISSLVDAQTGRRKMYENLAGQRREGNIASGLLDAMGRVQMEDPQDIIGLKNLIASRGAEEGMHGAIENATRTAMRTGNTAGAADIAGRMGVQQGQSLADMFLKNQIGAREEAQGKYNQAQTDLANRYNMFQTRATQMPGQNYQPQDIMGPANALMQRAAGAGGQSSSALLQALGRAAPELNYQQPTQYGLANTLQNLGSDILGIGQGYDARKYRDQQTASAGSYLDQGKYKQGYGLW
jgi:hypothetical protein